ncbi:hypothetical protein [Palleronia sediminis]|uniref:hypothetical protein n=1 Tax=Palleronia sediminis TaxID=2547833 RepID=UPI001454F3D1|nr:hypothetical protein [Palleronia sediminis]
MTFARPSRLFLLGILVAGGLAAAGAATRADILVAVPERTHATPEMIAAFPELF